MALVKSSSSLCEESDCAEFPASIKGEWFSLLKGHFEGRNPEFVRGKTKVDDVINGVIAIIAAAVTIVVVAIPEGLPLAVTLTLAYSMKRMMADKAMVRKLSACETMGSATTICTDKTGTLTMNQLKVTKFLVGGEQSVAAENISQALLEKIYQAVGLNTTGSVYKAGSSESEIEFAGSPTEKAILSWAVMEMRMEMEEIRKNYTTLHVETFNSKTKRSGVLVKSNKQMLNNGVHVHWKGAVEMILAMCSSYYDINGANKDLGDDEKVNFQRIIEGMAASSLRCIAFAHKEIAELEVVSLAFLTTSNGRKSCEFSEKGN